jgi:hypothetical protein
MTSAEQFCTTIALLWKPEESNEFIWKLIRNWCHGAGLAALEWEDRDFFFLLRDIATEYQNENL